MGCEEVAQCRKKLARMLAISSLQRRANIHLKPGITIETMQQGIPPALELTNPNYWEGMRKAGIPEA